MGAGYAIFNQVFRLLPSRFASLLTRAHLSRPIRLSLLACCALFHLQTPAQTTSLTATWQPIGPVAVTTPTYGNVTGRITALAPDPNDATGNTLYLGATGAGVWKSTNAAGPLAAVSFTPLTDDLSVLAPNAGSSIVPSLSIGALAVQPAANPVVLAGTGDPNNATDSFYGQGLLRSPDGGQTWTLVQGSRDGANGNHSFIGLVTAGLAFSTATPTLAVAAFTNSPQSAIVAAANTASIPGLYYSTDTGVTWQMATIQDGATGTSIVQQPQPLGTGQAGNAATAVVWDALRKQFFAAVRYHGYYSSPNGITWTRLTNQPGTNLTTAKCPVGVNGVGSTACPIFRGALTAQSATGDLYALTVDNNNLDQGLWQDLCNATSNACSNTAPTFANRIDNAALEVGNGSTTIPQGSYNLTLSAAASNTSGTLLFAGTVDLWRCTLAAGSSTCNLRNTTNALDGCNAPAAVAPAQHALAAVTLASGTPILYLGNDSGLWRSLDGVAETGFVCSATDSTHFDNLNTAIAKGGSLSMVEGLAQHPTLADTILAGLGANGSAATTIASSLAAWPQLSAGEGGSPLLDPFTPNNWYLTIGTGINLKACTAGGTCTAASFAPPATIGSTQVAGDAALIDAPTLLDPANTTELLLGTCRVWRGPAQTPSAWSSTNALSRAFDGGTTPCTASSALIRSLAAGGPRSGTPTTSQVIYAGMAGALDGGGSIPGHLFVTTNANATSPTWTDTALPNTGHFDVSSIAVDPHDATGATVYATIQGFGVPLLYRSTNFGGTWTNVTANLPGVPANAVAVDPNSANTAYVALDDGVYVTQTISTCTTTNCWSSLGTALPNSPITALAVSTAIPTGDGRIGMLRAATYGRGIWQTPLLTAAPPILSAITLSPTSLTFATQPVGTQSAAQTITVTSTGSAPVTFTTLALTGDFTETDTCTNQTLAVGATCTVSVIFAPTATGARPGLLTIYANVPGGQATAALNATGGTAATIVLTPLTLTFAPTTINQTTAAQTISIANTGGTTATLQTPTILPATDFAITANTCAATLAASTACAVSIAFTPSASGTRTATFSITDSAGTQTATLIGTGNAPATDTLSPLSLNFGVQTIGTTSAAQTVTLTNAGDVPLTLIAAAVSPGDFSATNACGTSLAGHSSCAFSVTFSPTTIGARTATLTVTDAIRSQTVALTGTGVAPPGVSLTPVALNFAPTGVGLTSAPQTVTLTNNGGTALTISGNAISPNFLIAATTCGNTLAVSTACTLQIVFNPAAAGPITGTLMLTDNATGSPQNGSQIVNLSGAGIDFTLTANGPTTATLKSGSSATYALLLTSPVSLAGQGWVAMSCSGVPTHATCTVSPGTPALGQTTALTVTIATGVAANTQPPRPFAPRSAPILLALLLLPAAWIVSRRGSSLARLAVLLLAAASLTACGTSRYIPTDGTNSTTPTPPGTYNLVIAGSTAGLTHNVGLTLTVQ